MKKEAPPISERIKRNPPGMEHRKTVPHYDADPECKICKGHGYKPGDPYNTGVERWFQCSCVINRYEQHLKSTAPKIELVDMIGLIDPELELTWDHVRPDISDGILAVNAVRPALTQGHGFIFLTGAYGQAKTLVGKIMTAMAYKNGLSTFYTNMSTILDDVRLAFSQSQNQSADLLKRMQKWKELKVLFIDEIDRVNNTDWAEERIFQLIDHRYTLAIRKQALTVIASNASAGQLNGYIESRLKDNRLGPIVKLNGPDGRTVMPENYHF